MLILAGDISDDQSVLRSTFELVVQKFNHVFFVPGNHDLWVRRKERDLLDSLGELLPCWLLFTMQKPLAAKLQSYACVASSMLVKSALNPRRLLLSCTSTVIGDLLPIKKPDFIMDPGGCFTQHMRLGSQPAARATGLAV